MFTPSTAKPASIIIPTMLSGNFGKPFTTNLRCGCTSTKITQNTAKYIIYGVKMESNIAIANKKQYAGRGRFSPWILEPSHKSSVGQNTSIINGVPLPAKYKNGVDSTIKHDASSETLLLNHRLSSKINRKPSSRPITTLGNFIAYDVSPNIVIDTFWSNLYGRSTKSPFNIPSFPK